VKLHADTLATVRVALRADPARFDSATVAKATAAVVAAVTGRDTSPPPGRAISQAEAARLLSCSRWSVRRLVATGKLRPVRLLGGLVRFDRQQVEALLLNHENQ
jgi:excisionase family DNA binding protein